MITITIEGEQTYEREKGNFVKLYLEEWIMCMFADSYLDMTNDVQFIYPPFLEPIKPTTKILVKVMG